MLPLKKLIFIVAAFLVMSLSSFGQDWIPIVRSMPGSPTEYKQVYRDYTKYPKTDAGNKAFIEAVRFGYLAIVDRVTTTPTNPTTTASYQRVLIVGNSIAHHPPSDLWTVYRQQRGLVGPGDWGMDASTADKDFVSILKGRLRTLNPNVVVRQYEDFAGLSVAEGPYWESNYWNVDNGLARYDGVAAWKPDLIIIRIAENVTDLSHDFPTYYRGLVNKLKSQNAAAKIVLTTSVWNTLSSVQVQVSNIAIGLAAEGGYQLANLNNIAGATSGYANHPNDAAMASIADIIWSVIPKSVASTPIVTTPLDDFDYPTVSTLNSWKDFNGTVLGIQKKVAVGECHRIETSTLIVEIRKNYGGGTQIYYKPQNNKAVINYHDHGRGGDVTLYSGPNDYSRAIGGTWFNIGYDPIWQGNDGENGSPIRANGEVTDKKGNKWYYTKCQMYNWPSGRTTPSDLLPVYGEKWVRAENDLVYTKFRITFDRPGTDDDHKYGQAYQQEWPVQILNGAFGNVAFVTSGSPIGTGNVTIVQPLENKLDPDRPAYQNVPWGFDQTPFYVSEPWQAVDMGGFWVGLHAPNYYRTTNSSYQVWSGGDGPDRGDSEGGFPSMYITSLPRIAIGPHEVKTGSFMQIVSPDLNRIRTVANSQPRISVPNYTFNSTYGRNEWYVDQADDNNEPFPSNTGWKIRLGAYNQDAGGRTAQNSAISSPAVRWEANQINTLYIRMKYVGPQTKLQLFFLKNGQAPEGVNTDRPKQVSVRFPNGVMDYSKQIIDFPVTGDGVERTYTIPVSSYSAWNQVIQQVQIRGFKADGETVEMKYIGTTAP